MKLFLIILVSFIAATCTLMGLLMISDPDGEILQLPLTLLEGTPFNNYLVPGVLLTALVGGINIIAVYTNMSGSTARYSWSMAGGIVIIIWMIVQIILIQSAHWVNFIYLGAGVLIILTAYQLKGKWAV